MAPQGHSFTISLANCSAIMMTTEMMAERVLIKGNYKSPYYKNYCHYEIPNVSLNTQQTAEGEGVGEALLRFME